MKEDDVWKLDERDREVHTGLMYVKFKTAIGENLRLLEKLSGRDVLNQIAWLARNLLELLVWVKYCDSSEARAKEFWDDSIRDLYSLVDPDGDNDQEFLNALSKAVALIGTEKEPNAWKRVSKAASAVKQTNYEKDSQTFSKFVHPTAMSVLIKLPSRSRINIQKMFADEGKAFASEALKELESSSMAMLYKKYKASIRKTLNSPEGKRLGIVF